MEVSDALQQEKDENIRLKQYLDQILKVNLVQISDLVNCMKTFVMSFPFSLYCSLKVKYHLIYIVHVTSRILSCFLAFVVSLLSSLLSLLHYIHYNLIVYKKKHFDN